MTLEELEALVKQLLTEVNTLKGSVATLTNQVSKEFLQKLLDVQINDLLSPLTFGDILLYGSDGKWHNIAPGKLGIESTSGTSTITRLSDLSDVLLSNVENQQVLMYNSTSNKWTNGNVLLEQEPIDLSAYLTKTAAEATYFKLTGGTINGDVTIDNNLTVHQNVTADGNIYADGAITAKAAL